MLRFSDLIQQKLKNSLKEMFKAYSNVSSVHQLVCLFFSQNVRLKLSTITYHISYFFQGSCPSCTKPVW